MATNCCAAAPIWTWWFGYKPRQCEWTDVDGGRMPGITTPAWRTQVKSPAQLMSFVTLTCTGGVVLAAMSWASPVLSFFFSSWPWWRHWWSSAAGLIYAICGRYDDNSNIYKCQEHAVYDRFKTSTTRRLACVCPRIPSILIIVARWCKLFTCHGGIISARMSASISFFSNLIK